MTPVLQKQFLTVETVTKTIEGSISSPTVPCRSLEVFVNLEDKVPATILQRGHHRSLLVISDPPLKEIRFPSA